FPDPKKYPEMYGKWLENVNRNAQVKFMPTGGSRLCSEHFSSAAEMKEEGGQRVILTPFAVPTIFPISKVMKNGETSTKKASIQDFVAVEQFNGMSDKKSSLVETVVINEDSVSDEGLSLQVVNEEIIATDSVRIQEVIEKVPIEDNVNVPLYIGKRKYLDETEIEVSMSQKRARTTSSSENNANDHVYCVKSPRRVRREVDDLTCKVKNLQKKLRLAQQKTRRRNKKVSTLTAVVSELREKNLINSDCVTILESTFSGVPKELMKRLVTQKKKKNLGAYPPELRSFALTLKFYSTKAYNYVRKSFDLGLPHVNVIRSWYSSMNDEPGFTKDALTALKAKVLAAKRDNQEVVCTLMLDEMAIRKHVEWDGKQFRGYVDLGTGINDDSLPEATEALVFMAVSVNSGWKVPCGYFLVNGITGEQKANLTKECITKLHEVGVKVVSFTCDGPTSHQTRLKLLGAQLLPDNLQAYFQHPCDPKAKIYIFLDACHMIKLVRNTMSDWKALKDGNVIKWQFVEELHKLQESWGLHLANKLRSAHIKWKPQKMKVNLAAQALCSSVADALEYCEDSEQSEGLPEMETVPYTYNRDQTRRRCYQCGKPGHIAKQCKQRLRSAGPGLHTVLTNCQNLTINMKTGRNSPKEN
ncbi:DNA transposase THAP9, partial [Paramuricea clavata]